MPAYHRLLQAQETDKQDVAREEIYIALRKLADQVKGPFFLGEQFSLVDAAIAPWVLREYILEENRNYKRSNVSDAWNKYAHALETRDSVKKTHSVSHLDFESRPTFS